MHVVRWWMYRRWASTSFQVIVELLSDTLMYKNTLRNFEKKNSYVASSSTASFDIV